MCVLLDLLGRALHRALGRLASVPQRGAFGDSPTGAGRVETMPVVEGSDYVRAVVGSSLRSRGRAVGEAREEEEMVRRLREDRGRIRLIALDADLSRMGWTSRLRERHKAGIWVRVVAAAGNTGLGVFRERRSRRPV